MPGFRDRKRLFTGCVVTGIVVGAFLLRALSKVLAGNGLDTYRNVKGALMNYAGAVVTGVLFVVCMVAALIARWWHFHQERKYEETLRERAAANTEATESARTDS